MPKISDLTADSSIDGTEVVPASQSGSTKKVTVQQIADFTIDQIPDGGGGGSTTYAALTDAASVNLPTVNTPLATALGLKANAADVSNVNNTSDANKPVSTAQAAAIAAKQDTLVSGTNIKTINGTTLLGSGNLVISGGGGSSDWGAIGGTITDQADLTSYVSTQAAAAVSAVIDAAPGTLNTLNELAAALGDDPNYAATTAAAIALKAPLASPTFTGTVSGITKAMVGLGSVDNTADTAKPVSTAQAAAIALKQDTLVSATNIKTINGTSVLGAGDIAIAAGLDAAGVRAVAATGVDLTAPTAEPAAPTAANTFLQWFGILWAWIRWIWRRLRGLPTNFNVLDYGALGNGVNDAPTRAANTAAIHAAIDDCIAEGAGTIYFPYTGGGHYYHDPVTIPKQLFDNDKGFITIRFLGEKPIQKIFGTVGTMAPDGLPANWVVLECPSTTPGAYAITVEGEPLFFSNFSAVHPIFENIEVRTYNNPIIGGINAFNAQQLTINNVAITTGLYSVDAGLPVHDNGGLLCPHNGNGALTKIDDLLITGYNVLLVTGEHMNADGVILAAGAIGVQFNGGNHATYIKHLDMMNIQTLIKVQNPGVLHIDHLNMEFKDTTWQARVTTVDDPWSLATGQINWANTKAGVGPDKTIVVNGARGLSIRPLNIAGHDNEVIGDVTGSDPVLLHLIQRLTEKGIIHNETSAGVTRLPDDINGGFAKVYTPSNLATSGWINTLREWDNATVPAYAQVREAVAALRYDPVDGWAALQYKGVANEGVKMQIVFGSSTRAMGFYILPGTQEIMWMNNTTETGTAVIAAAGNWYAIKFDGGVWTLEESANDGASWSTIYTFSGVPTTGECSLYWFSGDGSSPTAGTVSYPQGTWGSN